MRSRAVTLVHHHVPRAEDSAGHIAGAQCIFLVNKKMTKPKNSDVTTKH